MRPHAQDSSLDLAVIGGGINGAAAAREAAARGLSVCLLEREDFGSGTTATSTRLIHGGLRYLKHGEFGLVRESLRERAFLLAAYPHLVRPLPFLLPVYDGSPYSPLQLRVGLRLYDLLARDRSLPRSRRIPLAEGPAWEPYLRTEGLRALFAYTDAQVDYPERLCLEYVLDAQERGAEVANYTEVIGFLREGSARVAGVLARDRITGAEREIRARVVVNAAGPWVDRVNGLLHAPGSALRVKAVLTRSAEPGARNASAASPPPRLIGAVKGSHLVLPRREEGPRHAIYSAARRDGRPFFILPWAGMLLIGTTEVVTEEAPEAARCTAEEIDYLLAEANTLFPALDLGPEEIAYTYAGLRPLPASKGAAGAITRRHFVVDHAPHGAPGLLSIVGGKLTTAGSLAVSVVNAVERRLRAPGSALRVRVNGALTRSAELRRRSAFPRRARSPEPGARSEASTSHEPERSDLALYGSRAARVRALAADPELARPLCPHSPVIGAQVRYAVEAEMARRLSDVMLRRTPLGLALCRGEDAAPAVARLMAPLLGWDEARIADELAAYAAILRTRRP